MDFRSFYSREELIQINRQFYADRRFRERMLTLRNVLLLGKVNAEETVNTAKSLLNESLKKKRFIEEVYGAAIIGTHPLSQKRMLEMVKEELAEASYPALIAENLSAEKAAGISCKPNEKELPEKPAKAMKALFYQIGEKNMGISDIIIMGREKTDGTMEAELSVTGILEGKTVLFNEHWELAKQEFYTLINYLPKFFEQFSWTMLQCGSS